MRNVPVESEDPKKESKIRLITPSVQFNEIYAGKDGIVVTSCLNDTPINMDFFKSLEKYCDERNFALAVIPIKYLNPSALNKGEQATWPRDVQPYILKQTVKFGEQFKIIGDCNIQATATHPLTGIDGLCEGMTTIVGHPVMQMNSLATNHWKDHIILHSTGCVSVKTNYSASKAGYRASFHHCFGAVVIEFDRELFHIRQLLGDTNGGFADLDKYWTAEGSTPNTIDAIYTGDEHVMFADEDVTFITYDDHESIVNTLKPKYILRGDVLDCNTISHHHMNDFLSRFTKNLQKETASIEIELKDTMDYIVQTTPEFSQTLLVGSNHNDHLQKWLNIGEVKHDYVNAVMYHHLMYRLLEEKVNGGSRNAFEIYVQDIYKADKNRVSFADDGFSLHGICLSMHGDLGPNGARGSAQNLSKIGERSIIGHSHTPKILGGTWQVGTSSKLKLDYTKGPSSWMHTHCIVHPNGKRQLINIVGGRWRSDADKYRHIGSLEL